MRKYSEFFQTLHDETPPYRMFSSGAHHSVLRAVVFGDSEGNMLGDARFHDFAVIWDGDHDDRVIEPIEKIYLAGLLPYFLMFGEYKGSFTAIATDDEPPESLQNRLAEITEKLPDPWPSYLQTMEDPGHIVAAPFEKAYLYLSNIVMLWELGIKPAKYREISDTRQLLGQDTRAPGSRETA